MGPPVTRAGGISWRKMRSAGKWDFGDLICRRGESEEAFGHLSEYQAGGRGSSAWENPLARGCTGRAYAKHSIGFRGCAGSRVSPLAPSS